MTQKHRLDFIDALRGLAILLVVAYHAYVRWAPIVPFGDRYGAVPVLKEGWLGVQLFFMISGFVIYMSLQKCHNLRDFMLRRWMRLFPAMLICSIMLFVTAGLLPDRPGGAPVARDLLPGLSFIGPHWWAELLGPPQGMLEGGFWSLFVEVKFYLIVGMAYFLIGPRSAIAGVGLLFGVYLVSWGLESALGANAPGAAVLHRACDLGGLAYFGWFAAGALYFKYFEQRRSRDFWVAAGLSVVSALTMRGEEQAGWMGALGVCLLFGLAMFSEDVQRALSQRTLILFGFISYPLYLINESPIVAMTVAIGRTFPQWPGWAMPLLPIVCICVIAWAVATWGEPWMTRALTPGYQRLRRWIKA